MRNKILHKNKLFTAIDVSTPKYPNTVTIIDNYMLAKVSKLIWTLSTGNNGPIVKSTRQYGNMYLSRYIMDAPLNIQVDHKNRNPLWNTVKNLRLCSNTQNCANRGPKGNKRFKGTKKNGKKFAAKITKHGIEIHLGTFNTEVEAAIAYNEAAKIYHGEFAYLNNIPEKIKSV